YDVWLVVAHRIYQAVPYEVLSDWLQQGRVTSSDRVRPAGQGEWQQLDSISMFAVYLPQAAPKTIDDRAEALEPVDLGIAIRHKADDDEDVDMVPLIDI